ncbi:TPA: hypothetical protein CPT81_03420 [Candidatus Gastranaerophilales bacterium HUM_20]|jgi:hypothetical protein|nr:MAG: hypothetical protein BHW55_01120 [Candidatus Melainabacteria bacterium 35_41]CDE89263.1 unknown [Clostridium sp. CAG:729]DAB22617.1 MAG TPA: hypothetical protein CPT81_03420 [Candidatus Gastranaerophilales bacterium HUM_20]
MGMAASQARFLGLTARKTNVEFEGQQINQQRTTLSNQSANYYNDLLGMSVPVPPSVDDYTKTVYTFEDGALTNQITAMIAQNDGTYTVSYLRQWTDDFSVVGASTSIVNANADKTQFKVGSTTLRKLGTIPTKADGTYDKDAGGADSYLESLSEDQIKQLKAEEDEYIKLLENKYGAGDYLVRYIQDTTTGEYNPYFYKLSDLQNANYDDNGNSQSNINCYKVGSETKTEEVKAVEDCLIEKDSSGRYINITIPNNGNPVTYSLTTSTVTDQDAYEDAMNQYEYEKYEYDQAINEINAKIEIIQSQDKNLELRLKQLDTEQKAISTEIDAVSQVIQKNTESTFKTFG